MSFDIIYVSSRSLTIELNNKDIYYTEPYDLYVNEELYLKDCNKIVTKI